MGGLRVFEVTTKLKFKAVIKTIALALSLSFLTPYLSWAFQTSSYALSVPAGQIVKHLGKELSLPEQFGTIQKGFQGADKTIICIQDLHCNYEVQKNISNIIEHFNKNNNLQLIGEEGAFNTVNMDVLHSFPMKTIRKQVSDYFVKQGRLTGAEYFTANHNKKVQLEGVEVPALYDASYKAVQSFLNAESQGHCWDLREMLNELKLEIYTEELLRFDDKRKEMQEGQLDMLQYSVFLKKQAQQMNIDTTVLKNLTLYLETNTTAFSTALDIDGLYKEMDLLDLMIREQLYTNDNQRVIDQLSTRLELIEKLLNISVSQEELDTFRNNRADYNTSVFSAFIRKFDHELLMDLEIYKLDDYLKEVETFYKLADDRSIGFVENLLGKMSEHNQSISLMINGGFHIDKVLTELEQRNVTYLSIVPRLTRQDVVNPYFNLLQGKKSPLEKLLSQNQNIMAVRVFPEKANFNAVMEMNLEPLALSEFASASVNEQQALNAYFEKHNIISLEAVDKVAQAQAVPEGFHVFMATVDGQKNKLPVLVTKKNVNIKEQVGLSGDLRKIGDFQLAIFETQQDLAKALQVKERTLVARSWLKALNFARFWKVTLEALAVVAAMILAPMYERMLSPQFASYFGIRYALNPDGKEVQQDSYEEALKNFVFQSRGFKTTKVFTETLNKDNMVKVVEKIEQKLKSANFTKPQFKAMFFAFDEIFANATLVKYRQLFEAKYGSLENFNELDLTSEERKAIMDEMEKEGDAQTEITVNVHILAKGARLEITNNAEPTEIQKARIASSLASLDLLEGQVVNTTFDSAKISGTGKGLGKIVEKLKKRSGDLEAIYEKGKTTFAITMVPEEKKAKKDKGADEIATQAAKTGTVSKDIFRTAKSLGTYANKQVRDQIVYGLQLLGMKASLENLEVTFSRRALKAKVEATLNAMAVEQSSKSIRLARVKRMLSVNQDILLSYQENLIAEKARLEKDLSDYIEARNQLSNVVRTLGRGKKEATFHLLISDEMDAKTHGIAQVRGNKIVLNGKQAAKLSDKKHLVNLMKLLGHESSHIAGLDSTQNGEIMAGLLGRIAAGYQIGIADYSNEKRKVNNRLVLDGKSSDSQIRLAALAAGEKNETVDPEDQLAQSLVNQFMTQFKRLRQATTTVLRRSGMNADQLSIEEEQLLVQFYGKRQGSTILRDISNETGERKISHIATLREVVVRPQLQLIKDLKKLGFKVERSTLIALAGFVIRGKDFGEKVESMAIAAKSKKMKKFLETCLTLYKNSGDQISANALAKIDEMTRNMGLDQQIVGKLLFGNERVFNHIQSLKTKLFDMHAVDTELVKLKASGQYGANLSIHVQTLEGVKNYNLRVEKNKISGQLYDVVSTLKQSTSRVRAIDAIVSKTLSGIAELRKKKKLTAMQKRDLKDQVNVIIQLGMRYGVDVAAEFEAPLREALANPGEKTLGTLHAKVAEFHTRLFEEMSAILDISALRLADIYGNRLDIEEVVEKQSRKNRTRVSAQVVAKLTAYQKAFAAPLSTLDRKVFSQINSVQTIVREAIENPGGQQKKLDKLFVPEIARELESKAATLLERAVMTITPETRQQTVEKWKKKMHAVQTDVIKLRKKGTATTPEIMAVFKAYLSVVALKSGKAFAVEVPKMGALRALILGEKVNAKPMHIGAKTNVDGRIPATDEVRQKFEWEIQTGAMTIVALEGQGEFIADSDGKMYISDMDGVGTQAGGELISDSVLGDITTAGIVMHGEKNIVAQRIFGEKIAKHADSNMHQAEIVQTLKENIMGVKANGDMQLLNSPKKVDSFFRANGIEVNQKWWSGENTEGLKLVELMPQTWTSPKPEELTADFNTIRQEASRFRKRGVNGSGDLSVGRIPKHILAIMDAKSRQPQHGIGGILPWMKSLFTSLGMKGETYNRAAWAIENTFLVTIGGLLSVAVTLLTGTDISLIANALYGLVWLAFPGLHLIRGKTEQVSPINTIVASVIALVNTSLLLTGIGLPVMIALTFVSHFIINRIVQGWQARRNGPYHSMEQMGKLLPGQISRKMLENGVSFANVRKALRVMSNVGNLFKKMEVEEYYHNHTHNLGVTYAGMLMTEQFLKEAQDQKNGGRRFKAFFVASLLHDFHIRATGQPALVEETIRQLKDILGLRRNGELAPQEPEFYSMISESEKKSLREDILGLLGDVKFEEVESLILRTDFASNVNRMKILPDSKSVAMKVRSRLVADYMGDKFTARSIANAIADLQKEYNKYQGDDETAEANKRFIGIEIAYYESLQDMSTEQSKAIHTMSQMLEVSDQASFYFLMSPEAVENEVVPALVKELGPEKASVAGTFQFFLKSEFVNAPRMLGYLSNLPERFKNNLVDVTSHFARRGSELAEKMPDSVPVKQLLKASMKDWQDKRWYVLGQLWHLESDAQIDARVNKVNESAKSNFSFLKAFRWIGKGMIILSFLFIVGCAQTVLQFSSPPSSWSYNKLSPQEQQLHASNQAREMAAWSNLLGQQVTSRNLERLVKQNEKAQELYEILNRYTTPDIRARLVNSIGLQALLKAHADNSLYSDNENMNLFLLSSFMKNWQWNKDALDQALAQIHGNFEDVFSMFTVFDYVPANTTQDITNYLKKMNSLTDSKNHNEIIGLQGTIYLLRKIASAGLLTGEQNQQLFQQLMQAKRSDQWIKDSLLPIMVANYPQIKSDSDNNSLIRVLAQTEVNRSSNAFFDLENQSQRISQILGNRSDSNELSAEFIAALIYADSYRFFSKDLMAKADKDLSEKHDFEFNQNPWRAPSVTENSKGEFVVSGSLIGLQNELSHYMEYLLMNSSSDPEVFAERIKNYELVDRMGVLMIEHPSLDPTYLNVGQAYITAAYQQGITGHGAKNKTPSQIYYAGKAELSISEYARSNGLDAAKLKNTIDGMVGTLALRIAGQSRIQDSDNGDYYKKSENMFMNIYRVAERLSADVTIHISLLMEQNNIDPAFKSYVMSEALPYLLNNFNPASIQDYKSLVETVKTISPQMVQQWAGNYAPDVTKKADAGRGGILPWMRGFFTSLGMEGSTYNRAAWAIENTFLLTVGGLLSLGLAMLTGVDINLIGQGVYGLAWLAFPGLHFIQAKGQKASTANIVAATAISVINLGLLALPIALPFTIALSYGSHFLINRIANIGTAKKRVGTPSTELMKNIEQTYKAVFQNSQLDSKVTQAFAQGIEKGSLTLSHLKRKFEFDLHAKVDPGQYTREEAEAFSFHGNHYALTDTGEKRLGTTDAIIEKVINLMRKNKKSGPIKLVDVGTGALPLATARTVETMKNAGLDVQTLAIDLVEPHAVVFDKKINMYAVFNEAGSIISVVAKLDENWAYAVTPAAIQVTENWAEQAGRFKALRQQLLSKVEAKDADAFYEDQELGMVHPWKNAAYQNQNMTVVKNDITTIQLDEKADIIRAANVRFHLTDEIWEKAEQNIAANLNENGYYIEASSDFNNNGMLCSVYQKQNGRLVALSMEQAKAAGLNDFSGSLSKEQYRYLNQMQAPILKVIRELNDFYKNDLISIAIAGKLGRGLLNEIEPGEQVVIEVDKTQLPTQELLQKWQAMGVDVVLETEGRGAKLKMNPIVVSNHLHSVYLSALFKFFRNHKFKNKVKHANILIIDTKRSSGQTQVKQQTVKDMLGEGKINEPLFAKHVVTEALYQARESIFGKQFDLLNNVIIRQGRRFSVGYEEVAPGTTDVTQELKAKDAAFVITVPAMYSKGLKLEAGKGVVNRLLYAAQTRLLGMVIKGQLRRYAKQTRSMLKEESAEDQTIREDYLGEKLYKMPLQLLPNFGGQLMGSGFYRPKGNRQIGVTGGEIGKLIEAYRNQVAPSTQSMWQAIAPALQSLLQSGETPSTVTMIKALRQTNAKSILNPTVRNQVVQLQQTLNASEKAGDAIKNAIEINHAAELLVRSKQGIEVNQELIQAADVSDVQDQVNLLMDKDARTSAQAAVASLISQTQRGTAIRAKLQFLEGVLGNEQLSGQASSELQLLLQEIALNEGQVVSAVIGEDVSEFSGSAVNGKVESVEYKFNGQTIQVAKPVVASILADKAAIIENIGELETAAENVIVVSYKGKLPQVLDERGSFNKDLGSALKKSSLFKDALAPTQALAQSYFRFDGKKSATNKRRMARVMIRMLKQQARQLDTVSDSKATFDQAMHAVSVLFKTSDLFKAVELGTVKKQSIYVPVSLKRGGQYGMIWLWNKQSGDFKLNDKLEEKMRQERLKNFRMSAAA